MNINDETCDDSVEPWRISVYRAGYETGYSDGYSDGVADREPVIVGEPLQEFNFWDSAKGKRILEAKLNQK